MNVSKERRLLHEIARSIVNRTVISQSSWEEIDWESFLIITKKNKVFPAIYQIAKDKIPEPHLSAWDKEYSLHVTRVDDLIGIMSEVCTILVDADIPFSVMKGLVLSQILFQDVYMRHTNDIDLLFPEPVMNKAFDVLSEYGYYSVVGSEHAYQYGLEEGTSLQLPYPLLKGSDHHEFFEMWKRIGTNFYGIEIQRYLHATVRDLSAVHSFIASNRTIAIKDATVPTFDLEHTLLCLCENTFAELTDHRATIVLKNYLDLGVFIRKYGANIHWAKVIILANQYQMGHVMIQGLSQVNSFYGELVSQDIIQAFNPKESLNNWRNTIEEMLTMSKDKMKRELKRNRVIYLQNKEFPAIELLDQDLINVVERNYCEDIQVNAFKLNIRYFVTYENENLRYHLCFDNSAPQILFQYPLKISFLDTDLNSLNDENSYLVEWNRDKNIPIMDGLEVPVMDVCGKKMLVIDIPMKSILNNHHTISNASIFKFSIISNPYFNVYHTHDAKEFTKILGLPMTR